MKSILVVEDSESYHFLTEIVVKEIDENIVIYKAYDGQEALELLTVSNIQPDIILLDINMPRMNGHDFLIEYSKVHDQEIPIVAMLTSSDQVEDKEKVQQYQFVKDYIVKPLKTEHLLKLNEIIKNFAK